MLFCSCEAEPAERSSAPSSEPGASAAEGEEEEAEEPGSGPSQTRDDPDDDVPGQARPTDDSAGFALGDGGGVTDPTRAVRAWFREHSGCDPLCGAGDPERSPSDFSMRDPRRLSSTALANGFAQLWHAERRIAHEIRHAGAVDVHRELG